MQFMKILQALLLLTFALYTLSTQAAVDSSQTQYGLHFGFGFGGNTLDTVEFVNSSNKKLKAGGGFIVGGFVQTPLLLINNHQVTAKVALSYKADSVRASNGDASFSRTPLDLILRTQVKKVTLGLGATYHLNPNYRIDIEQNTQTDSDNPDAADGEIDFSKNNNGKTKYDDALGFVIEASLGNHWDNVEIGLRYTQIQYQLNGTNLDGSGLTITMSSSF